MSLLLRLLQGELDSDKRQTCGVTSQVSAADQVKIVNKHNEVRQHAQSGASAMLKMVSLRRVTSHMLTHIVYHKPIGTHTCFEAVVMHIER